MSEVVRVRMLLAKMVGDDVPCVIAAVDESIWEHWTDGEELDWISAGKRTWGIVNDSDFRLVAAEFAPDSLAAEFAPPTITGSIDPNGTL
jgi:hypothetical protein